MDIRVHGDGYLVDDLDVIDGRRFGVKNCDLLRVYVIRSLGIETTLGNFLDAGWICNTDRWVQAVIEDRSA